jgi:hypothetical protein
MALAHPCLGSARFVTSTDALPALGCFCFLCDLDTCFFPVRERYSRCKGAGMRVS